MLRQAQHDNINKAEMLRQTQHDIKNPRIIPPGIFLGLIVPSTIKSWVVTIAIGTH